MAIPSSGSVSVSEPACTGKSLIKLGQRLTLAQHVYSVPYVNFRQEFNPPSTRIVLILHGMLAHGIIQYVEEHRVGPVLHMRGQQRCGIGIALVADPLGVC